MQHYEQFCCDKLSMRPRSAQQTQPSLYTARGERKYLNRAEHARAVDAARLLPQDRSLFCLTLAWTGARVSEVLALRPIDFDLDDGLILFRTLKRRRLHIRQVPAPTPLLRLIERGFELRGLQADPEQRQAPLWRFHRVTAWRIVKRVMASAKLQGAAACPKAFRHGFGASNIQAGIPVTLGRRAFFAVAFSAGALADTVTFKAGLNGSQEVPANGTAGTGTATYDSSSKIIKWTVSYSGLTGPATMGHIHGPAEPGKNAPVVVPFANAASPIEGSATLTDAQAADLLAGKYYVNVHTAENKGGEIRGQLLPAK